MKLKLMLTTAIFIIILGFPISFYAYVLRVAFAIGHIPSYNNPDPSYIYVQHRTIIDYTVLTSMIMIIMSIVAFFFRKRLGLFIDRWTIYLLWISILINFSTYINPFMVWYVD